MKKCDECDGVYYAKNKCVKHYFKSRRTTTRELIAEDAQCTWEGCERRPRAKGLCGPHYNRAKGYNKGPSGPGGTRKRKEVVGYRAAHVRVEAVKGKAKIHQCVCGNAAQEWSLNPDAEHTIESEGRVWSLNVDDYDALCCRCHRIRDNGYGWQDVV